MLETLTEGTADFLVSDDAAELISLAMFLREQRMETLPAITRLRKLGSPALAAASWELADLRRRGAVKFGADAARLFFTRESLEQASSRRAAAYHASAFAEAGVSHICDLCGGIGGDALAFARAGLTVTLFELDPARAVFARANADICGYGSRIEVRREDVTRASLPAGAAWFDPARRENKRRIASPDDYLPSLLFVHNAGRAGHGNDWRQIVPCH